MALPDTKENHRAVQKQVRLPTPLGGLNTADPVIATGPEYAYVLSNFLTKPYGIEVRKGYKEWLPSGFSFGNQIRTLMGYSNPVAANQRLFACESNASSTVWNITTPNTAPISSLVPGAGADVPGEWYYVNFNTPAENFLCAILANKGYYTYSALTGWTLVADGTGAGKIEFKYNGVTYLSTQMTYVFSWKNRLWFLQKDSALLWYLPTNQITGTAAAIDLGQLLKRGGSLYMGLDWTYDSGDGLNAYLVLCSSNGDMVIYQGSDPSTAATFQLKGTWYIGRVPYGRRGFCAYGGDTLIATEYGIVSVSDMVSGRLVNLQTQSSVAPKYNPSLAVIVSDNINTPYFQLISFPTEDVVILASPAIDAETGIRFSCIMSHFGNSWSNMTQMDILTAIFAQGNFIFADRGGKVFLGFTGFRDAASYDGTTTVGAEVTGTFATSFQSYGSPNSNKRAQRIRLLGRIGGSVSFGAKLRGEYDLSSPPSVPSPASSAPSIWDVNKWNESLWQTPRASFSKWFGTAGFGKLLSLQVSIRGLGSILLTDYEVTYEEGIGL